MSEINHGDEFIEETDWYRPHNDYEYRMLAACGRRRFPTQALAKSTHEITSLMVDNERKYPSAYITKMVVCRQNIWDKSDNLLRDTF